MEQLIYIEQKDKDTATELTRGFTTDDTKNRVFINALGAELAMKYLAQENISVSNVYNMHNIHKVRGEFDIADVMLPNIHIDVRVVYDENLIFVPKSHFEWDITPDLYLVFKMSKDLSFVEFLGFFEPRMINKNNQNGDYYFFEKEKLSHPGDLKTFIENFEGNTTRNFSQDELEIGQKLAISLIDNEISENDKKSLLSILSKSSTLREDLIEFDNFEVISYHTATNEDLETVPVVEQNAVVDEFDMFDNNNEFDEFDNGDEFSETGETTEDTLLEENENEFTEDEIIGDNIEDNTTEDLETGDTEEITEEPEDLDITPSEEDQSIELPEEEINETELDVDSTEDITENDVTVETTEENENSSNMAGGIIGLAGGAALAGAAAATLESAEAAEEISDIVDNTGNLPEPELSTDDIPQLSEEETLPPENINIEDISVSDDTLVLDQEIGEISEEPLPAENIEDLPAENIAEPLDTEAETEQTSDLIADLFSKENYEDDEDKEDEETEIPNEEPTDENLSDENLDEIDSLINPATEPAGEEQFSLHEDTETGNEAEPAGESEISDENENVTEAESGKEIADETTTENQTDEAESSGEETEETSDILSDDSNTVNFEDLASVLDTLENDSPNDSKEETLQTEETPESTPSASFENSTVISSENSIVGEIPIDINSEETANEEEKLEVLYNENGEIINNIDDTLEIGNPSQEKGKKAIILASAMVALLAAGVAGGYMMMSKNNTPAPQQQQPPKIKEEVIPPNLEDQPIPEQPQQKELQPQNTKPAAENPQGVTSAATQPAEGDTPYIDVQKLGWSVPNYLSYNDTFKKYLQTAGKSLKLSLSSDLLMATEYNYSDLVQVDITLSKEGTIQDAKILQTSGSSQIDSIVLQTVKETLNVVKAPAGLIDGDSAHLTLKIYL